MPAEPGRLSKAPVGMPPPPDPHPQPKAVSAMTHPREPEPESRIITTISNELLMAARRHIFDLEIINQRLVTAHSADPTNAITRINDVFQYEMNTCLARADGEEIPAGLFGIRFVKAPPGSKGVGRFELSIPDLLKQFVTIALQNDLLQFTRDDVGNRWALKHAEHTFRAAVLTSVADDDDMWFHYFPAHDSQLDIATHFSNLQVLASSVGINIPSNDPRCFYKMTVEGERDANKYHVAFSVDWGKVPRDKHWGVHDMTPIKRFPVVDPETGDAEHAHVWFNPSCMKKVFFCCNKCHKSLDGPCKGHDAKPKEKRPYVPPAAVRAENAQRRMRERNEKRMKGSSSSARF